MVFPILFSDSRVQIGELIRFDASDTKGDIKTAKITIEGTEVTFTADDIQKGKLFVDWIFNTAGAKTVRVDFTDTSDAASYKEITVTALTPAEDKLFNTDEDLIAYESKVRSYIPAGRSTWNFVHREVKKVIFEELTAKFQMRIDDAKILSTLQFREWAKNKALEMIFRGINNTESDVFATKAEFYGKEAANYRTLAFNSLEIDFNEDGEINKEKEKVTLCRTIGVSRC